METLTFMAKDGKGKRAISVPAEYFNPTTGKYDPTRVPRDERCRIVGCPEIAWRNGPVEPGAFVTVDGDGPYEVLSISGLHATLAIPGDGVTPDTIAIRPITGCKRVRNPKCASCSGPVQWRNHMGRLTGDRRSCTNCPMNGLRLPICIHGCPGPNTEFASDGEKMVTLGSFADPSSFIYDNLPQNRDKGQERSPDPDCDSDADRKADGIPDDDEPENATAHSARELNIAKKLMALDGRSFDAFRETYKSGNADAIAKALGTSPALFRGAMAEGNRIMRMIRNITGDEWDVIREIVKGNSQTKVAGMTGVRKQAVNSRLKHLVRLNPWVGRICK